jgi:type II secretory pathway component PulK
MRRRGSVYILSLAVMTVLILIGAGAAQGLALEVQAQSNRINAQRAERLAESAIDYAMVVLADIDPADAVLEDEWASLGEAGGTGFLLGEGSFRLQVIDASSLININTSREGQLEAIGLTSEQIDSLLDWREAGREPRQEGAKDLYYNQLDQPYNTALRSFSTPLDLLLVRGFTPALVFQPLQNTTQEPLVDGEADEQPALIDLITTDSGKAAGAPAADDGGGPGGGQAGGALLDANTATVQQLVQRGFEAQTALQIIQARGEGFGTLGEIIEVQGLTNAQAALVLDNLQIGTPNRLVGKLNLNTVSETILKTLPDIEDDVIQAILGQQGSFASLGELAELPGVTLDSLAEVADDFAVGTDTFIVRVMGEVQSRRQFMEAIVRYEGGRYRILRRTEPAFSDVPARWRWPEEAELEVDVQEGGAL